MNKKKGKSLWIIKESGQIIEIKGKKRLKRHFNYNIQEQNGDIL